MLAAISLSVLASVSSISPAQAGEARFAWFEYSGTDGEALAPGEYRNPVLAGFHPDPSLVRVGEDFYLATSTFAWFPGIPVFHSRDLVNWTQIGNAIDRADMLRFDGLTLSRGVFAPAITFHDGTFYIANTCVDCGGNFVITARDPAGPWSDPVWLPTVEGIDPSLFFDDDGSAWLINNRSPAGPALYDGHRALWIERFDPAGLKMMGNPKMIVDGGIDLSKKPVWIEGPHIYKRNGKYYLSAAEGGTSVNHSQVILRADRADGPSTPAPPGANPILTQRDLAPDRRDPISAAGHADIVELPDGRFAATFLATRPYDYGKDFYNLGRETFLLPVDWSGEWPVILEPGLPIPLTAPAILPAVPGAPPMTGSFTAREEFGRADLGPEWMTMRAAPYALDQGELVLTPGRQGLGDLGKPAFVARRQQHDEATATTEVSFEPAEGEMAGLAALQNDDYFLTVAVVREGERTLVRVSRRAGQDQPRTGVTVAEAPLDARGPVRLRLTAHGGRYDFAYAIGGEWQALATGVDGTHLSTATAGGFVGTMIGPFAQGPH
ncbi:MAG TPA: glycoside hydrolase family 43 protein [Croceibacterium sp.]